MARQYSSTLGGSLRVSELPYEVIVYTVTGGFLLMHEFGATAGIVRFEPQKQINWNAPRPTNAEISDSARFSEPLSDPAHILRQVTAVLGMKARDRVPVDAAEKVAAMLAVTGLVYGGAVA